ncbi:putative metallo-beta-lactamase domain protein [Xylariales sp. PMI_506]|nr:putative metallo-beta-lactamase domain protein [Xylariales sp. PMI_506]
MAPGKGGYRQINKALNLCVFEDYLEAQADCLPELPDVEQITPRVLRVLGQNPGKFTFQGTNTYIVGTGPERLIIDTGQGIPDWADLISTTLSNDGVALSHVLLTHWHGDHTGGVPDLLRMYPYLDSAIYKNAPDRTQQPIQDGQIFKVEGATVRAVHTPGHSHDHMCFILEEENAMFTGDNLLGHGTAAVENLSTWMKTLQYMKNFNCSRGYPAHGVVIEDMTGKLTAELAGKLRRERQVLKTLDDAKKEEKAAGGRGKGSVTVHQVVETLYGTDLDTEIREMALKPFMDEVLRKLAEDGKVAFEIRAGVKKWFSLAC